MSASLDTVQDSEIERHSRDTALVCALRTVSQPMQNAVLRVAVQMDLLTTWSGQAMVTNFILDDLAARSSADPAKKRIATTRIAVA